jgi:hypothetical protein
MPGIQSTTKASNYIPGIEYKGSKTSALTVSWKNGEPEIPAAFASHTSLISDFVIPFTIILL